MIENIMINKFCKRYSLLLFYFFLTASALNAQSLNNSILVSERKIDRPLTLHKGQLQFNPGYEISLISKEYDTNRDIIVLADVGTASVLHKYYFELNFGILDFLQASIKSNYSERGERHETQLIWVSSTEPYLDVTYFDDYKGFEELYLGAILKIPLQTKRIEITFAPGVLVPLFSNTPEPPENSIQYNYGGFPITKIIYHNNHKSGNGATAIKTGASALVRPVSNFSIYANFNYSWPVSESESVKWIHQLDGSDFIYEDVRYKYLIGNTLDYEVCFAYQAISWFNICLSLYNEKTSSGWSEITGFRIGNTESGLSLLSLGYEIKATGNLWINQSIKVPVTGKNQLAPFSIFLGISHNMFPFKRN